MTPYTLDRTRYAASIILSITYGRPSPSFKSDPDVALIYQCLQNLGRALRPGAHLVDDFPWLKHIPFYGRALREQHAVELDLFQRQMQGVRNDLAAGNARKSFGKYLIEAQNELALSDDEIAYLAGSMFGAGSDTTASALRFICMAAACFPEAQKRVQDELDEVIGPDRLPTFADWDALPQAHAFFLEVFRWRPATVSGMQHRAIEDIIYNGYRIPAGATIIPNHWSIGRDPSVFANGDAFNPQRWIDVQGNLSEDPKFPTFGFGRRLCPGSAVATRSLFINTALLLQSFRVREDAGHPIDTLAVREGVIMQPAHFKVRFEVRREG
ncbi:cytochrome P450, partial [Amylostereum chailletii]